MKNKIKVGILISYDYQLVFSCIKQIYDFVDEIYLAVDANNKTWAGGNFEIPESFYEEIEDIDTACKIIIYSDNFFVPSNSSMENETRERNMLSRRMGQGWQLQLDCDEYIYGFAKITHYLKANSYLRLVSPSFPITFVGNMVTLFKKVPTGYLYIENNEQCPFLFNAEHSFNMARNSRSYYKNLGCTIIHQSWARREEQMLQKIKNWGHNTDFDTVKYLEFWRNLDATNYRLAKNIHPIQPEVWPQLHYMKCDSIDDFIDKYSKLNPQKIADPISFREKSEMRLKHLYYSLFQK